MATAQIALPCNPTSPTGTASIPALARATLPSVSSSVATTAGLCLLDTAGRAVEISEYTVDTICNAARTTITFGVGFVVGVLPLPHFVYSGIMGATSCATGVAAALAKCSTRVLLGPAYMAVAARSGLAIQQTVGDTFGPVSSQADVLAHLIMDSAGVPSTIKADLRSYVELRSRLHSLPEHERGSINHQILRLEISLGSYRDFQDLKSALEGPADFMLRNRQRIDALAVEAAERVLARTRAFYRERVGKAVSGEVALCSAAPDSPEYIQARRALTEKITARLMSVLTEEVSDAQVSAAIRSVRGDMLSAFGTYRATWRAAISSIVAVSAATGVLPEVGRALYDFVQPVAGAAGELLEHCCSWVGEQAVACAKSGCMYIWEAFCTHFPEAAKGIKYLFALDLIEQGEMAARKGEYTRAEDLLRQASVGLPGSTRLLKAQGAVCLATGRVEEAKVFFERALNISPSDANLLTAYGMCMVVASKPAEAMPLFERVLAQNPDHILALHQLLECSYAVNAFSKAESAVRRYLSVKPQDTSIRFCLAGILYKQGLWAAASAELSRVVSECPEHQSARELQELITKQIAEQNPQAAATPGTSQAVMQSMQEAVEESTADGTGAAAEYFRTRDEENAQAMSYLDSKMDEVEELKRDGKYDEAKEILEKVRRSPGLTQGQRERFMCIEAEFLVMDSELEEADRAYDSILKTNASSPRAMCGKGALAAERQEWTVAQGWFEKALTVNPKHDVGLAGLGLCAMVSNKEERAFELFTAAVAANPENRRALLGVLQLGYPLKKYTEIEKAINAYLELHPANVEMLYSFAGVLFAQGKVEQAKVEVEKILIFEPKHERALELRDLIRGEKPEPSVLM